MGAPSTKSIKRVLDFNQKDHRGSTLAKKDKKGSLSAVLRKITERLLVSTAC